MFDGYFLENRRLGLARSRLTAIPSFAAMTSRHFAKTLQPQLTRATPKKMLKHFGSFSSSPNTAK